MVPPEEGDRITGSMPDAAGVGGCAARVGAGQSEDQGDTLLLDEPTNHIGAEARELLIEALRGFRGIGLCVSHDRELLNELTSSMDLPSIERIEEALAEYPGALILISHDHALARRCTSIVWSVVDGNLTVSSAPDAAESATLREAHS